jgi:hypothetical protein
MAKNYLTYPCKILRITQNYNGKTSHYPHTTGSPKDYPIDEACKDSGRDWLYCPCDKMVVKRNYTAGTNTLWLESTEKVNFADGTSNYFTMLITHPNNDDMKNCPVGKAFERGDKICREGTDGATANHLHISGGKGKFSGNGWTKNSNGKYVLSTTKGAYKPEKLFYIDTAFTTVISKGGIAFKTLPKTPATTETSKAGYTVGNYQVVTGTSILKVRSGAGTTYAAKKFNKLTSSAQAKILQLTGGVKKDGYVNGLTFTATEVNKNWGKTPSGWVCLDYCEKMK